MSWLGANHGHLSYQEQVNMREQSDLFLKQQHEFNVRDRLYNERKQERHAQEEAQRIQRQLELDAEVARGREEATRNCYTPDLVEMFNKSIR